MTTVAERAACDIGYLGPAHALATVTTANGQLVAIPSAWDNQYVDFTAEGVDVWIRFGDSGVQVDRTGVTTMSGAALQTENAKAAHLYIPAGTTRSVLIRKDATMTASGETTLTHFAHISTATSGYLRMTVSTGNGEV